MGSLFSDLRVTVLFLLLAVVFSIREVVAWRRLLTLKYLFTPLIPILIIGMVVVSIVHTGADNWRVLVLLALVCSLTADTLLMIEEHNYLKNGIVYFLSAHLLYILAFAGGYRFAPWHLAVALALALGGVIFSRMIRKKAGKMFIPVAVYISILSLMVFFAYARLSYTQPGSRALTVTVGATMFMASDIILATNAFIEPIEHSTVYTWALYAPAQLFLALSCFE